MARPTTPASANHSEATAVSPDNPCPFLRAAVAGGCIDPHTEPVSRVADLIAEASGGTLTNKRKVRIGSAAIAAVANGLGPLAVLYNLSYGLHADALRGGPLDKRGAGSRILDPHGELTPAELDRLDEFAADFQRPDGGGTERGLGLPQLRTMMDANYARSGCATQGRPPADERRVAGAVERDGARRRRRRVPEPGRGSSSVRRAKVACANCGADFALRATREALR